MEFSRSVRLRRSMRRWVASCLVLAAGSVVWAVSASGHARNAAYAAITLTVLSGLAGIRQLRRMRQPFRLRIDATGITLVDGALDWGQIEGVALYYSPSAENEGAVEPNPHLYVYPAPGALLPGRRTRLVGARRAYDLADSAELDQGVGVLIEALTRYAGPRFEGAPHGMRRAAAPGPATLLGPGFGPLVDAVAALADGLSARPPQTFAARRNTGARLLFALALGLAGTLATLQLLTGDISRGPEQFVALGPIAAITGWPWALLLLFQWTRPLRLRIGPEGLGVRNSGDPEVPIRWDQVVAVTVGPRPGVTEKHLWLLMWPVPGENFGLPRDMVDGHQTYALVELRQLHDAADVEPVVRYFAGARYAEPA